ncbi:MAG TPA: FAD-dependent oxidoreductase [Pseudonocardiaceae bacterium]|jgi:assimilatory nitrate reductase electron transfer subunit|nr:FAD-dependent oxidoreductase [Pseudonocardiaceae bacterium]
MKVVVIGYGMAGARLAELIRAHDPDAAGIELTVLGAEPHRAYNRVLLSTVLAGGLSTEAVELHDEYWAEKNQVDLRIDTAVRAIDRDAKAVLLADGSHVDYDALVLATGSRAWMPPVDGLSGECVSAFRTIDDCARIVARARAGASVVVLGGGLLGLEAARGLVGRGCAVTLVHPKARLMERQLDPGAAAVLRQSMQRLGVTIRLDVEVRRHVAGQGVELGDGSFLPADLVVVSAGVRAEDGLAARAGLAVDNGIVVDEALRTADSSVFAIGDCAKPPSGGAGLVQPAWEQAAVVAARLTGENSLARYTGTPMVVRLKARDVELAALGDVHATVDDADAEVVQVHDPARGRYAKLVLRADRVAGAILLGVPDAAATIVQLYDSGALAPSDRLALLLGRALPGAPNAASPGDLPASAVVCRCNTVTKGALVSAWQHGACDVAGLVSATRATTGCGTCKDAVTDLADWLTTADPGSPRAVSHCA